MEKNNINTNTNKYKKYEKIYKNVENDLFWGLGIENELYLEFEKNIEINETFFLNNHINERYSVNYFLNYKDEFKNILFEEYLKINYNILKNIPLILNSHSFINTDKMNQSKTLYKKITEINPKFIGETLLDNLLENSYFKNTYNKEWLFDGDTIEFTTLNFYNSNLEDIINELNLYKKKFILNLQNFQKKNQLFQKYGLIKLMNKNYPFAIHLTNNNNIAIFNNGTLHYNITLPTLLKNKKIINYDEFVRIHMKAIKLIQWFEPLLIAVYNTSDPFIILKDKISKNISGSSQRCAISRYISIGTYDSDKMLKGKILTIPISNFDNNKNWWYNRFHENSVYNKLKEIGLDINFNKHYNHGIELRFFDYIADNNLLNESFEFIIYLIDYILENDNKIPNPIYLDLWNNIVYKSINNGKNALLNYDEIEFFENLLNIKLDKINKLENINNINNVYYNIYFKLIKKYNKIIKLKKINSYKLTPIGNFSKLVLNTRIIKCDKFKNTFKCINLKSSDILSNNIFSWICN